MLSGTIRRLNKFKNNNMIRAKSYIVNHLAIFTLVLLFLFNKTKIRLIIIEKMTANIKYIIIYLLVAVDLSDEAFLLR